MIHKGVEYRGSLRDGRAVFVSGARVRDVATHPMFRPLVDLHARTYDMAHEPATRATMTYDEAGERHAIGNKRS